MTTEAPIKTPAQILAEAIAKRDAAKSALDAATQAFTSMSASGMKHADGTAYSTDEMLKIAGEFASAPAQLESAEKAVTSAQNSAKLATLDGPMTKVRDGLAKLLVDNGIAQLLADAEAGLGVNFTCAIAHDPNDAAKFLPWAVSRSYKSAAVQKATADGASGDRGSVTYEHAGKTYTSRELIAEFAPALIANGTLNWSGDPLDSTGLTHRADVLATKLGATKSK